MTNTDREEQTINDLSPLDDLLRQHGIDFIHATYMLILGRAPDPEGLRFYLNRLNAGCGKRSIVAQIARSPERTRRVGFLLAIADAPAFVTAAYHALLGRAPDPDGFQNCIDLLRQGGDRSKLLHDIAASSEAQARALRQAQVDSELSALLEEERRARHWFWRWFARGKRLECEIHRLEVELGRWAHAGAAANIAVKQRLDQIETRLDHRLTLCVQREHSAPSVPPQNLDRLSPHAQRIHRRLAVAANA